MASASLKQCKNCGESFFSQNGAYCGMRCYKDDIGRQKAANAVKRLTSSSCEVCGVGCKFNSRFCSESCRVEGRTLPPQCLRSKRVIAGQCKNCGCDVMTTSGNSTPPQHCSRACYDAYRVTIQIERTTKCEFCNSLFIPKGSKTKKYCSMDCRKRGKKAPPVHCPSCGTWFTAIKWRGIGAGYATTTEQKYCSKACVRIGLANNEERKKKISKAFRGSNHPLWQGGGQTSRGFRGVGWKEQAEKARKRDGHQCQHCGLSQEDHGRALEVHHKVPFSQETTARSNRLSNLVTLCKSCHTKADHEYRRNNHVQMALI